MSIKVNQTHILSLRPIDSIVLQTGGRSEGVPTAAEAFELVRKI
jgi:hypothetical protein